MAGEQFRASRNKHAAGVIHSDLPHHHVKLWGQTPLQAHPVLAAIVTAVQGRIGALAPARRRTRRGGGVESIWTLLRRHQRHRITAFQAVHEVPPVLAAVIATIKSSAGRGIQPPSFERWRHRVDVPIQSLVQALPGFTLVTTAINAALLDANVHGPYNLRVRNY